MQDGRQYRAFISYSHVDETWARWLHRSLETYRVPRWLVGRETSVGPAPASLRPIFRDRGELAADPDLKASVSQALERSEFLIVVCSPAAAHSRWVNEEILAFKRLHGEARVFSVVVGGEPQASEWRGHEQLECFPHALRFRLGSDGGLTDEPAEPVAADLRPGRDGRRVSLLKLCAGMLGVGLDELIHRDAQRRHNRLLGLATASGLVAVAMGALAFVAVSERNEARAQRAQAEGLIEFMLSDLGGRLESVGRLDVLDAVGKRAMVYYAAQDERGLDPASVGRRARVMQLLGDVKRKRGNLAEARTLFEAAAKVTGEHLARHPNDPQMIFDHSQSLYWLGALDQQRGDLAAARPRFEGYRDLTERLVKIDPKNDAWRAEAAMAGTALGVVKLKAHRADEAAADFSAAQAIFQDLAAKAPADIDRQYLAAQGNAWLADVELARGRSTEALRYRLAERAIYQSMLNATPADAKANYSMAVNRRKVAAIYLAQGRPQAALTELMVGAPVIDRLIYLEPEATNYREEGADTYIALATAQRAAGVSAEAASARALELAQVLANRDTTHPKWRMQLGQARLLQLEGAWPAGRSSEAAAEAEDLLKLAAAHADDRVLAGVAAKAALLAGDAAAQAGRRDQARTWWSKGQGALTVAQATGPDPLDVESQGLIVKLRTRLST